MSELVMPYHGYGAPELKKNFQKYTADGFVIAVILHFIMIGSYWTSTYSSTEEEPKRWVIRDITEIGPPPSITNSAPVITVSPPAVKQSVGIPVSVPDTEVNPDQTIPPQDQFHEAVGPVEGIGNGNVKIEIEEPPPDFVNVEKDPMAIKIVKPTYPEIARRAGIEGKVEVRVWVDKEGKVRKAEILKSDADIFNQPAQDAAMQWVFTPALMNNASVSVWVSIPFHFKLQGQ